LIINILYIIFIVNSLIQLGYWGILFSKFYSKKSVVPSQNLPLPPLSIVICARNEARNLSTHLIYILQQNYKTFEVVVVNDASDDDSLLILQSFQNKFSFLNIINIDKNAARTLQGKKQALTAGIAAAKYDWILVTDADCRPRSTEWATMMMQTAVLENKEIVLGYSPYFTKNIFLNAWIRLETIYTALQYISFANWGLPYMGVGRNMLYRKSLFLENGGLAAHADLPSGDDDLFMRDVARAENTTVCLSANAFVDSAAKETWGAYAKQKTRHLSTSTRYKPLIQILLGALSVSHLLVYICTIIFLFCGASKPYIYGIIWWFGLRWLVQIVQLFCVSKILQEKNIWKYLFVFDFILFLYLFVMSFSFLKRKKEW
jgi:poly-beta-1,6-N-acetyl-D-glucosamine synthase